MRSRPIILCERREDWAQIVEEYARALHDAAPGIGNHGLDPGAFVESGLFSSAIERLRGQRAASTAEKYSFVTKVLDFIAARELISSYVFVGSRERHDFEVLLPDGRLCCIEAKGCLDGNNTTIFVRPENADEFIIWSLCQNPGADPRHNAWSGIHTRLSAEIVASRKKVDGVVIWDMLCGTLARPCPKLAVSPERHTLIDGKRIPPPCIYLFPRTVPDARNNPAPQTWKLSELPFLYAMNRAFQGRPEECVHVAIEARMKGSDVQRRTTYTAGGRQVHQSGWTTLRRAR